MSRARNNERQLVRLDCLENNYQQPSSTFQVQILKYKLKEEKLTDKMVYQSIKDKISTH